MLFNSLEFIVFFSIVLLLYFYIPYRFRWLFLLISSCYFYVAFIPVYILVLFLLITIDYTAGILIEKSEGEKRRIFLIISIISTCIVLFIFKYFNFANHNLLKLAKFLHWNYPIQNLSLILPIGLSFHAFQSLSYVIEVSRRRQKAEHHFGIYALYVMFFPQLVAGPIERPYNLLKQFYEEHTFDYKRVTDGLKLMAWGFFKKIVIADRLTLIVNPIYNSPHDYSGPVLVLATFFFAYQIYCDFSGYTDIARGTAEVLDFRLMENFRAPYLATSIQDFWRRWHISLSTWFRDYVYISLGGNRVVKWRWYYNLIVTFFLSGLWHGANWTYVVWGLLHGFYMVIGTITKGIRLRFIQLIGLARYPKPHRVFQIIITFSLVCFGWIFFRAKNISDAYYIATHLFTGWELIFNFAGNLRELSVKWGLYSLGITKIEYLFCFGLIAFLEWIHSLQQKFSIRQWIAGQAPLVRWGLYYTLVISLILGGHYGQSKFIYFQF